MNIAFLASETPAAQQALAQAVGLYGQIPVDRAEYVVALGGDGHMLKVLHAVLPLGKPVYGMRLGSLGFLLNAFNLEGLPARLAHAQAVQLHPLHMQAQTTSGQVIEHVAFNEVSLTRHTPQAAKIRVMVDEQVRLPELVCDGVLVATAAGSTGYNLSAHGPILPLNANLLALTPISAFRPRRWRGALLSVASKIQFDILDVQKRPVSAVADFKEVQNVLSVRIAQDSAKTVNLLFDPTHNLADRIIQEQFEV